MMGALDDDSAAETNRISGEESTSFQDLDSGIDDVLEAYLARRDAGQEVSLSQIARELGVPEEAVRKLAPALALMNQAAASRLGSGQSMGVLGDYRLVREIGRGGMGVVYEAIQERLKRRVALKVMTPGMGLEPEALARFRREAGVASRLDHPGICTVHDAGEVDGVPYIAMTYVEGETLSEQLKKLRAKAEPDEPRTENASRHAESGRRTAGRTPQRREVQHFAHVIERVARAVHAAHEVGVLHRDLKPANIMIPPSGEPVVLDFGLARDLSADAATLTATGEVFGTPAYMAPEQVVGKKRVDLRVDVYALGVTLFECLTLRRPFNALSREGLYRSILEDRLPDPRKWNPAVPSDLCIILATAMDRDPDRRYQSALALAEDLDRFRAHLPIHARPVPLRTRALRFATRHPALAALGILLAVGLPLVASLATYAIVTRPQVLLAEREERWLETERALEQGMWAMGNRDNEEAIAQFRRALTLTPSCGEALAAGSSALRRLGRTQEALDLMDAHADLVKAHESLRALRAHFVAKPGETPVVSLEELPRTSALDLFVAAQQEFTHEGDRVARGRAAVGFLTEAIARSRRARRFLHLDRIHAAGLTGDLPTIQAATSAMIELWPEWVETWIAAGRAFRMGDAHKKAIAAFDRALVLDPSNFRASVQRIDILNDIGQFDEAERQGRALLEVHKDELDCVLVVARAIERAGRSEEALQWHQRASELGPNSAEARYRWGGALLQAGKSKEARVELTKTLALEPTHASALFAMAHLERLEGHREEALAYARRLQESHPEDGRGVYFVGETYLSAGEYEAARPALEEAVTRDPTEFLQRWALIHCLVELKDFKRADAELSALLELFPENTDVREKAAWVKEQLK